MKRIDIEPRYNWQQKVNDVGMYYHTIDGQTYWNESAAYELSIKEIDKIELATQELHDMCLSYVDTVVITGKYDPAYGFTDYDKQLIEHSWKSKHPSLYGRFDLGINEKGQIKMFEYNADTPTSLLEASVVQWNWLQNLNDTNQSKLDQFNSIHEKLIDYWKSLSTTLHVNKVYFSTMRESPMEDWGNLHYMLETASEAGINCSSIDLEELGWDSERNSFVDSNEEEIFTLFKLYPWEWMKNDEFYNNISNSHTMLIEPPWKMLLSNKLLCVKLWEMFPNNCWLLPAYKTEPKKSWFWWRNKQWLKKPMLGREGQGVTLDKADHTAIAQEYFRVMNFDKIQPVIGSWIIGGEAAGIGIREDIGVTTNNSKFVPHYFR